MRQVEKMLAAKVIQPSQAPWLVKYISYLIEPLDWRFTIDYRKLNKCSESKGWPMPNVYRMLQRLGNRKAKFYAVMDLTYRWG